MSDLKSAIIQHQRENEWYFAAALFSGYASVAAQEYAWLLPDIFIDAKIKKYWKGVLETGDALKPANDLALMSELADWAVRCPSLMRWEEYARAIADDSLLLKATDHVSKMVKAINDRNASEVLAIADDIRMMPIAGASHGKTADQVGIEFEQSLDDGFRAIPTYIPDLDRYIGGMFEGDLIIVAARPSVGKTPLTIQIARNASSAKHKVDYFSLEMNSNQLWARMACPLAGLEWEQVRLGNITAEQKESLKMASRQLRGKYAKNLIVIDDVYTIQGIHQTVSHTKPDLVIVDMLGEIIWHDPDESKVSYYAKIAKYLRHYVARNYHVPVILNHHINRNVEARDDKRPRLADLRDSGDLEQRADVVLLLHRDDMYVGREVGVMDVDMEVNVAKNRQGKAGGTAVLNYNLKEQWFT